jgi:hypothetical protein
MGLRPHSIVHIWFTLIRSIPAKVEQTLNFYNFPLVLKGGAVARSLEIEFFALDLVFSRSILDSWRQLWRIFGNG